jgi:hypothetical protein
MSNSVITVQFLGLSIPTNILLTLWAKSSFDRSLLWYINSSAKCSSFKLSLLYERFNQACDLYDVKISNLSILQLYHGVLYSKGHNV